jgi:hypothetical protein
MAKLTIRKVNIALNKYFMIELTMSKINMTKLAKE